MNFPWAYPVAHFEEGKCYESCDPNRLPMKVIKRCNKTIVVAIGNYVYRMKIRKAWNDIEYAFYYMSSKEEAYWATLKVKEVIT